MEREENFQRQVSFDGAGAPNAEEVVHPDGLPRESNGPQKRDGIIRRFIRRRSKGDIIFDIINYTLVTVICLLLVYPFLYMISVSLTGKDNVSDVILWPVGVPNFNAYIFIFKMDNILRGFGNTFLYTFVSLAFSMVLTVGLAYAMSKKFLVGKKLLNIFVLITMYFSGGLIPTYITITSLGMVDNIWAMTIPAAINTYNMIVMRTYFMSSVPDELEEAAEMDGAGTIRTLVSVYLPLSMPILMTIGLFYFVASWNSWFGAQIYLDTPEKYPIQLILRNALESTLAQGMNSSMMNELYANAIDGNSLNYALTIVVTLPLLILFPFLQKFFVKGVIVGSLKG